MFCTHIEKKEISWTQFLSMKFSLLFFERSDNNVQSLNKKISWHTFVIFRENSLGGRLLKSSKINKKNITLIYEEDNSDDEDKKHQKAQNLEGSK